VKFTPPGGHVRVRVRGDHGKAAIEVSDDGEGIEEELLPHIFERFRQGSSGIRKGGLGLGLSIVQTIVALHGGSASAASEGPGRGSTFTVRLPLLRETEHARGGGARAVDRADEPS
jgi:signal transduction histidine kinase